MKTLRALHGIEFQAFWKEKGYWLNLDVRDVLGRLRGVWSLPDAVSETRSINTDTGFILFVQLQTLLPILLICLSAQIWQFCQNIFLLQYAGRIEHWRLIAARSIPWPPVPMGIKWDRTLDLRLETWVIWTFLSSHRLDNSLSWAFSGEN